MQIGLPRLIARMRDNDSRKLEFEQLYRRLQTGYSGELRVDQYLQTLALPDSIFVLKNVELSIGENHSFQIDTLIISGKFILILEIKNIAGDLYFQSNPQQLIRELNGEVTKMDCPIVQLKNAHSNLEKWLQDRNFVGKVYSQIILANQRSFVKKSPQDSVISFMKEIPILLERLNFESADNPTIHSRKLVKTIKSEQVVYNPFPLKEYFYINAEMLKENQLCPHCNFILNYQSERSRLCSNCQKKISVDYKSALQDWFIIFNKEITNAECRKFFGINCRHKAKYVLQTAGLKKVGKSVATKYVWPTNQPFKS